MHCIARQQRTRRPSWFSRMCFSNVVFPDPRNPDRTVTGRRDFLSPSACVVVAGGAGVLESPPPVAAPDASSWLFCSGDSLRWLIVSRACAVREKVNNSEEYSKIGMHVRRRGGVRLATSIGLLFAGAVALFLWSGVSYGFRDSGSSQSVVKDTSSLDPCESLRGASGSWEREACTRLLRLFSLVALEFSLIPSSCPP